MEDDLHRPRGLSCSGTSAKRQSSQLAEGSFQRRRLVQVKGIELQQPFQRMKYADALERYGSDKPDLRYGLCLYDVSHAVQGTTFR